MKTIAFWSKRILAEHELLLGVGVFGVASLLSDFFSDLGWKQSAIWIRGLGIFILLAVIFMAILLRRYRKPARIPLMFTETNDTVQANSDYEEFITGTNLRLDTSIIEKLTVIPRQRLYISPGNEPRSSTSPVEWEKAWNNLLTIWDEAVDRQLTGTQLVEHGKHYHIYSHVALPLSFMLGASVGLRRRVSLYHKQDDKFHLVLEPSGYRTWFETPSEEVPDPTVTAKKLTRRGSGKPDRLILIIAVTEKDRHSIEFNRHPYHARADCYGLRCSALDPGTDWIPVVQKLVRFAKPKIEKYRDVHLCLITPSVVAFALGIVFSRTPHITVCQYLDGKYIPVLSLKLIETRLPRVFS